MAAFSGRMVMGLTLADVDDGNSYSSCLVLGAFFLAFSMPSPPRTSVEILHPVHWTRRQRCHAVITSLRWGAMYAIGGGWWYIDLNNPGIVVVLRLQS